MTQETPFPSPPIGYPELAPLSTVPEVALFLSCSERKVRDLIARGELSITRIGRLVRVPRDALLKFVTVRTETPGPASGKSSSEVHADV